MRRGDVCRMAHAQLVREIIRRMEALGLNPRSLSLKAGLNPTAIRDIVEGSTPRADTLQKIAKALGCTLADLIAERPARRAAAQAGSDVVAINELDVHIAAGSGVADDAGQLMEAHEAAAVIGVHTYPAASFREAYGMDPARIKILPVRGTSMEPELWAGQRVMVDIADKTPSPPGIFVVWDGLGLVLKYVEVVANSDPLRVRISSAHQAFKPYERNIGEAYINGRVVGVWKRM
jgi:phage repressor protein C with HTH and peptisase S24 domain